MEAYIESEPEVVIMCTQDVEELHILRARYNSADNMKIHKISKLETERGNAHCLDIKIYSLEYASILFRYSEG